MDKSLTFRIAWGMFFLCGAILILLSALDVIPIGLNPFALTAVVLLAAFAAYSAYKLFWFGVFFPIALSLSIIDAGTEFNMNTATHIAVYVTALLISIAFTVIFHKKGTWKVWHKPTPEK
jgi:hypothetical protein